MAIVSRQSATVTLSPFPAAGPDPPELPEVTVNWHQNVTLEIFPIHVSQLPETWDSAQVRHAASL